jgi:serine/threonine protein kinase
MAIHVSIEGYDSLEQIGVGGMAAVYKARRVSIDKVVAVKVLFPHLAEDASFIERFQREARAAARIQHENIVNVIDFGNSGGSYFIVMEYYEGQTLDELLKSHREVPPEIAIQILLEVCYGLESAHKHDTVHRDIKPGNIIFTNQGAIKIADFGLAKKSDATSLITQEGKVIGTPAYMSPEQAAGSDVDGQSDIFSLGVVAYEILGHQKPFAGKSYSEVLEKIQTFEPIPVTSVNPLVQPRFEEIVSKMLEKDLDRRYRTIAEVIADIERAMESFRITRDRRRLAAYIADPAAFEKAYREKTISKSLSQGAYYMKKGEDHFDDAVLEFKRILYLDPDNERAKKNLKRITAENNKDKTVTLPVSAKPVKKQPVARKTGKAGSLAVVAASSAARRRRTGRTFAVLIVFAAVAAAWFAHQRGLIPYHLFLHNGNRAPVLSAPAQIAVSTGDPVSFVLQAVDAEQDAVRFFSDELPPGARLTENGEFNWVVDHNQAGEHRIRFHADDGTSTSVSETVIEVAATKISLDFRDLGPVQVDAGRRFATPLVASSTSGKRVRFSLEDAPDGMSVKDGKLVWQPDSAASGSFEAKITATDGHVSKRQIATFVVRSVAEQRSELARVEWELPEKANVYVDGDLRDTETRRITVELPGGRHTLRAELMSGATGWMESLDLNPGEKVRLEAPKLAYGRLSVYFLGGVGELRINGKLFEKQPPFSGVRVPVGTHRLSCRLANETQPTEFTVKVEKGHETVVEYEAGGEPVVTVGS